MILCSKAIFFACIIAFCTNVLGQEPYRPLFEDESVFEEALESVAEFPIDRSRNVTGFTVPHHLTARDLIAFGFRVSSGRAVSRVIVLTPDHFSKSPAPFATTQAGFESVYGMVEVDREVVDLLLAAPLPIELSDLFREEHGVHALTPFIAHFFPSAKVVPVAIRIESGQSEWELLIDQLAQLVDSDTLIVQSTDFSHYLPHPQAKRRDQETLAAISLGKASLIEELHQPENLDSIGAQYVQQRLQGEIGARGPIILANRNSQEYSNFYQPKTTSYVVQLYESGPLLPPLDCLPGDELWFFSGDAFFGRFVAEQLRNPAKKEKFVSDILAVTGAAPMVVNLEGVIVPELERRLEQTPLIMDETMTIDVLQRLNVRIAGLANNHSMDLGESGYAYSVAALEKAGIKALGHGDWIQEPSFRLLALTDLSNSLNPKVERIQQKEIETLLQQGRGPMPGIAFAHWGDEWRAPLNARQKEIAGWLSAPVGARTTRDPETGSQISILPSGRGIDLILGHHSHLSSETLEKMNPSVLVASSLGNLAFDQPRGSGQLAEVRFFKQGTCAVRLIQIENPVRDLEIPTKDRIQQP